MKVQIVYDPDHNKYFANIFNYDGELVGSTMFANSRQDAERLADDFIFNATYSPLGLLQLAETSITFY